MEFKNIITAKIQRNKTASKDESHSITTQALQRFLAFQYLDPHQMVLLSNRIGYLKLLPGETLFEVDDIDSNEFFLLSGELQLRSLDGAVRVIKSTDEVARRQIARLRPRQYTVTAVSTCELAVLDVDILEEIQEDLDSRTVDDNAYFVDEVSSMDELEGQEFFTEFRATLQNNKLVLPSMPEVALRVRELLDRDDTNIDTVANVVNADPAIAAKLIRAANSPLYPRINKCETTHNAIVRLGVVTARQLVISFALRDLFKTESQKLKYYMQLAWKHSIEVAAISFVVARMAKVTGCPPEEAMLAGLLHDIGIIAILGYIETQPALLQDDSKIQMLIQHWRQKVGEEILTKWKFSDVFIDVVQNVDNWQRNASNNADICDIVQIAKLHSYIRNKSPMPVSRIDKIPAFQKLPLGDLTPALTIKILDEAKDQIKEAQQVLLGDSLA